MKPTTDKVLVEADKPRQQTDTGIYINEDWKTLPPTGTVIAVGPDVKTVKKGDRVLFERYGSITVEKQIKLCKEAHILAIINENSKTNR